MMMKRAGHTKQGYLKALPLQELVKSYIVGNCLINANIACIPDFRWQSIPS